MANRSYRANRPPTSSILTSASPGPASSYHRGSQLSFLVYLQHTRCTSIVVRSCSRGSRCCVQGFIHRAEGNLGDVLLLFPNEEFYIYTYIWFFFFFLIAGQVDPQIHIQLFKLVLWLPGTLLHTLERWELHWSVWLGTWLYIMPLKILHLPVVSPTH